MTTTLSARTLDLSKRYRPPGFEEAFLSAAHRNGDWFAIDSTTLEQLEKQFPHKSGLGEFVKRVADPIAKGVDAVFGTNLKGCGDCQERREALNALGEKVGF